MKKLLALNIKGRSYDWSFIIEQDAKYLNDWTNDGLDVREISMNLVPRNGSLLSIEVDGKDKKWAFCFYGPEDGLEIWEADGLKVFSMNDKLLKPYEPITKLWS